MIKRHRKSPVPFCNVLVLTRRGLGITGNAPRFGLNFPDSEQMLSCAARLCDCFQGGEYKRGLFYPVKLGNIIMRMATALSKQPNVSGHFFVRLLIASYFMALAGGLIPGSDISALLRPFMPDLYASLIIGVVVMALALGVVLGFHRRAAALLLAIILFWSSYVTLLSVGDEQAVGAFWRDLALIGALLLTYADGTAANTEKAKQSADHAEANAEILPSMASATPSRPQTYRQTSKTQYREDFDLVRAS